MLLAAHIIFSAYGFWLPNAQSGSGSDFVRRGALRKFGAATKINHGRSVSGRAFDPALRAAAKATLMYPPVKFTGLQALSIAKGFAEVADRTQCLIHACAILPDHTHLVVGNHSYAMPKLANLLKGGATRALRQHDRDPLQSLEARGSTRPSPWAHGYWKVFLFTAIEVCRRIRYVEENPVKAGLRRQTWSFVTPYTA